MYRYTLEERVFIVRTYWKITHWFSRNTKEMQLCNRIYYSKVYWRLAFNKLWNNKFYYKLHLVGISTESSTMHGSMNINIIHCYIYLRFDVHKSVHHHTIKINQPTRCNSFTSVLLDVYVWLNMFRAPLRPSSGAYNCTRSLLFYRWSVAVGALLVVVWQITCQTTTNNAPDVGRRGARNVLSHT